MATFYPGGSFNEYSQQIADSLGGLSQVGGASFFAHPYPFNWGGYEGDLYEFE